jgi:uncharacterized protein
MKIKSLYVYPVKSLGGIALQEAEVTERGLAYDRRWVLADANGRFITQREHYDLALVKVEIEQAGLVISHPKMQASLLVGFKQQTTDRQAIAVWDDVVECLRVSNEADVWFSALMQSDVKLYFQPDEAIRLVDQKYGSETDHTSMSDGFPVLVISEASIQHLNDKISTQIIEIQRFRPNVVLEGANPHEEDTLALFNVGDVQFAGVKPCARCVMTTIDPATAQTGKEPLKTLNGYRKWNNKILFGENLLVKQTGFIKVGDELEILERKEGKL